MTRTLDVIISVCLMVLTAPILSVCVVLIKLDSGGPVIFKQKRVGRYEKPFVLLKLRTMCQDAEEIGPCSTALGDARITKVGSFLRKWSIDELPQLWNVFIGEMSLVGPRPATADQELLYPAATWKKRHSVKPGITGVAQAINRSSGTMCQNRRLDLVCVDSSGDPCAYLHILFLTFFSVASRKNLN